MTEERALLQVAGMALELVGAFLFIADYTIGALLLLVYTVSVTPVIHDFWNSTDESIRGMEIILFFKVRLCSEGLTLLVRQVARQLLLEDC